MSRNTAIIIATVGVILSLCVGIFGGAVAGFYVAQFSPRAYTSGQSSTVTPNLGLPSPLQPNQTIPNLPNQRRTFPNINTTGAVVLQVVPNSPAQKAGLQAGDVITAVDGQSLSSQQPLNDLVQQKKPGDSLALQVQRGSQKLSLNVTLGTNPSNSSAPYLGIQFTMFDAPTQPSGSSG